MLLTSSAGYLGFGHAGLYGVLGYAVVFLGLILLMFLVILLGKAFVAAEKNKKQSAPVLEKKVEAPVSTEVAPGSAGQLKLHDVDPKTAAMLMAIVANKLNKSVNELRFISIREVSK